MQSRPDGNMLLFIGVSRSGKSVVAKRIAELYQRVLAFDPKGEMATQFGYERITSGAALVRRCQELGNKPARLAFVAHSSKDFDLFCGSAMVWNMVAPCCILAEELARVTNPAKAHGNWGRLVNQGLAYGPLLIATVQRGQEVDKTVLNNCSMVHVCRHNTQSDREYIAGQLGVAVDLIPGRPLEFLQWTSDRGPVCQGSVDFPKSKASKYWASGAPRFREKGGKRRLLTLGRDGLFKQVDYR